ncbi:hypothetical protein HK099_007461, partial [Clydaea vesicula]
EVLISRLYRVDIKRSISDVFRIQVISNTDVRSPIITLGSTSFFHIKHENLYLVAVSKLNTNAALIFEFLYKVASLGKSYFGKFDEDSVKSNFTLIYELSDEICDFGYPQNTEPESLKLYITTEGVKKEKSPKNDAAKIAIQATGSVSWRRPDIKYKKNEAFVDVVESCNLLLSVQGNILRADVSAQVLMRCYLSGMPECKFGLNDKLQMNDDENRGTVELDDCQFHQCVRLENFDSERIITFIPPDGEFELMKYRSSVNVQLPFKVMAVVSEGETLCDYKIIVKSQFPAKFYAQNIILNIPTPTNASNAKLTVTGGKAKYVGGDNSIVWKIPRMHGQSELLLSGDVDLSPMTVKKAWSRPPITMNFSVLMWCSSGLVVKFLKIYEKSNYPNVKWVRYMTKAGSYQIRF